MALESSNLSPQQSVDYCPLSVDRSVQLLLIQPGSSNLSEFIQQVKIFFRGTGASRRISSIKHILTGAEDIPKARQQDVLLSTPRKKLTYSKKYMN